MKKLLLLLLLSSSISILFGQKKLKEFSITYEYSDVDMKKGNAMAAKMLEGADMTVTSNGEITRMDMKMMMMKTMVFTYPKEKKMRMFMSMMGQKIEMTGMDSVFQYSIEKAEKDKKDGVKPKSNLKSTGKKKKILDYDCEEFESEVESKGKKGFIKMFMTKEIEFDNAGFQGAETSGMMMPSIDASFGFPLEMTIVNDEISFKMRVKEIKDKVKKEDFVAPEDYKKMDMKDMQSGRGGF